jgi:Na+/melibiose symporter-like transporter
MDKIKLKVSIFVKVGYGIGNLGFGIVLQCISAYLLFYTTAVLGIKGSYIGTLMAIGVLWDALTDPLMGYVSDVSNFVRWGRRHLYMLIGTILISIFNMFLWHISSEFSASVKLMLILVFLLLLKTSLTVYGTPYTALGAELSTDYDERTSVQSYKSVSFMLGLAFPMVAGLLIFFRPTELYPIGQLNPAGYSLMGTATSALMIITGLICIWATYKFRFNSMPDMKLQSAKREEGRMSFIGAFKNKYFIYVFFGYLFFNMSSALIGSIGLHVFTYTFGLDNKGIAMVMGTFFGISIVSLPYWSAVSKKTDKKPVMLRCLRISSLACILFLLAVFLRIIVMKFYFILIIIIAILGFGTGGLFLLPNSMTADTIDYEELKQGFRSEGIYYGALTFGYKLTQSAVLFIVGILLDVINFDSSIVTQSTFTSIMLGLILSMGSLTAFGLAYLSMRKYDLNKEKIQEIQKTIMHNGKEKNGERINK